MEKFSGTKPKILHSIPPINPSTKKFPSGTNTFLQTHKKCRYSSAPNAEFEDALPIQIRSSKHLTIQKTATSKHAMVGWGHGTIFGLMPMTAFATGPISLFITKITSNALTMACEAFRYSFFLWRRALAISKSGGIPQKYEGTGRQTGGLMKIMAGIDRLVGRSQIRMGGTIIQTLQTLRRQSGEEKKEATSLIRHRLFRSWFSNVNQTASTAVISGTTSRITRSTPILSVIWAPGQPAHAPRSFTFTTVPSSSTNSTSPPSA